VMNTNLSSNAARLVFAAVKNANKLQFLSVSNNCFTDDVAPDIAAALTSNTSLYHLEMYGNPISGEAVVNIVEALQSNNTMAHICIPRFVSEVKEIIILLEEKINLIRTKQRIVQRFIVAFVH